MLMMTILLCVGSLTTLSTAKTNRWRINGLKRQRWNIKGEKTEILEHPIPVPLCPPQIPRLKFL
jgi:hypothetical protein